MYLKKIQKIMKIDFNMNFIKEIYRFLRVRKKYWLFPITLVLILLGGLIVLTQVSNLNPFIYTIF